ncbi:glycoside hydrolase family 6 protein [Streptomyces macrosporus]|uniref:Glucanase n=1 Tax=Streptomyces macrosporus TaxID=44032 RepID=A0ABP5WQG1_9ACTN
MGALLLLTGCSGASDASSDDAPEPGRQPASQVPYWVDPDGTAAIRVSELREEGRTEEAELIEEIARRPVAEWIGPDDPEGRTRRITEAAEKADRVALLVLYNIPHRDCGRYSKGGAADGDAYRAWLDGVVEGIGDRPATVIVEPDALPHVMDGCTPPEFHEERYALLNEAVHRLKDLPETTVYIDAGNPRWIKDPGGMVEPLRRAGIARADGFALNVSNYQTTEENIDYGKRLSSMVGGKHFVIDTSRNGNGPVDGEEDAEAWCNPPGRALGEEPTTRTGEELVDAYLWIKRPGESDGACKGGPQAGVWWEEYALELVRNAGK